MNISPKIRAASRSPLTLAFVLAGVLGASACTPIVLGGPGGGTGGAGEDDGTSSGEPRGTGGSIGQSGSGGSIAPPGTSDVATGTGTGGATTGPANAIAVPVVLLGESATLDPDTLQVQIGNYGLTCSALGGASCGSTLSWQLTFDLAPAAQVPGVIPVSDPSLHSFFWEYLPPSVPQCGMGLGSATQGTLEILSIDADTVVVKLSGTSGSGFDFDPDGVYTAPICPTGV